MPIKNISAKEFIELLNNSRKAIEIIDVRELEEFQIIHIKGSKLIPIGELLGRINEVSWDREVIFLCRAGHRSHLAASLVGDDFSIKNLQKGFQECFIEDNYEYFNYLVEEVEEYLKEV